MSFYDNSSLAFLPSSGAGKDGKAYSIKPVPEYGSELVTNGDFATDSDWTFSGSTSISNGKANFAASGDYLIQNNVVPLSVKKYKIQYEVISSNNGQLRTAGGSNAFPTTTLPNSVGVHSISITSNGTKQYLQFNSNGFIGSIDNVSVKEVLVGDGDFTFSRGSNLSATRIGPDGLIEKGRENLFTYSNDFTNAAWTKFGSPILTSGQSGYDGSSDAWLYESTTISHSILQFVSGSGVYSLSVYAKAGTADGIRLRFSASTDSNIYVDLTDGSIITNQSGISYNIESVGSGWYRVSITSNVSSLSNVRFSVVNNAGAGTDSGNIYIQDAQLEIGLAATDYIESGASTGKAGLLEDEPRFDYSGGATCPSLLLEPNRTNLAGKSEYIGGWGFPTNVTLTQNYGISPEGLTNSTRLQFTSNGFMNDALSQVNGTQYTLSIYAKRNDGGTQSFGFYVNGTPTIVGGITLTSDWQRFTYTYTASNSFSIGLAGNSGADVSVYGFQCEAGSYPTSYIPNHSGGTITRGADTQSELTIPNGSATEGTIFYEFDKAQAPNSFDITPLQIGSVKVLSIQQYNPNMRFDINNNAANYNEPNSYNSHIKVAASYVGSVVKLFINGNLRATDNTYSGSGSVVVPENGLQKTQIGCSIESKQVLYFPEALSDADCITLTTI